MDVNSKIRTRSRAKQQAEQWQMVPLPVKLVGMLADSVAEAQSLNAGQEVAVSCQPCSAEGLL